MFKKLFRKMILTQILTQLTITLCMLIDSIMIGQFLGVDEVAAYGFANPVLIVFTAIGSLLAAGIQVAASKHMGKGDKESINKIYTSSIAFSAALAAVGIVLIVIFISPLATLLGAAAGSEVHKLTQDYLLGFLIGIPAFMGSLIMMPFLQMSGKQKVLVVAIVGMTIADIALDFLTVKIGLFGGGIFGMGMASAVSYIVAFVCAIPYFLSKKCPYKFRLSLIKPSAIGEIFKGGAATTVNQLCIVVVTLLINNTLAKFGTDYVASHAVIVTCMNILYSFGAGVGTVTTVFVGISTGEEDREGIVSIIKSGILYSLVINIVLAIIVVIFSRNVICFFLDPSVAENAQSISIGATALALMAISVIPCSLVAVLKGAAQGRGKILVSSIMSALQNLVFISIGILILSRTPLGAYGIWSSYIIAETLTVISYYVYSWFVNKKVTFATDTLALFEPEFGMGIEGSYKCEARNLDEVIKASKEVGNFFLEHGASKRNAFGASLCVEEIAKNVLQYGFGKGSGDTIEMTFVKKKDAWVINICDNCPNFDPVEYLKLHEDEDPTSHIGIRMIPKMAKEAAYVNLLGLNSLTMTF